MDSSKQHRNLRRSSWTKFAENYGFDNPIKFGCTCQFVSIGFEKAKISKESIVMVVEDKDLLSLLFATIYSLVSIRDFHMGVSFYNGFLSILNSAIDFPDEIFMDEKTFAYYRDDLYYNVREHWYAKDESDILDRCIQIFNISHGEEIKRQLKKMNDKASKKRKSGRDIKVEANITMPKSLPLSEPSVRATIEDCVEKSTFWKDRVEKIIHISHTSLSDHFSNSLKVDESASSSETQAGDSQGSDKVQIVASVLMEIVKEFKHNGANLFGTEFLKDIKIKEFEVYTLTDFVDCFKSMKRSLEDKVDGFDNNIKVCYDDYKSSTNKSKIERTCIEVFLPKLQEPLKDLARDFEACRHYLSNCKFAKTFEKLIDLLEVENLRSKVDFISTKNLSSFDD